MGLCLSINSLIETLFGFTDKQIVGQNISKLCPTYYLPLHEKYFLDFFEREDDNRQWLNSEQTVYPESSRGFLIPTSIMVKSLPEIEGFVKMVAFLTPLDRLTKSPTDKYTCGILFSKEQNGIVYGVTENCYRLYGIHKYLVFNPKNEDFRLEHIMPQLFQDNNFALAEGLAGVEIEINTTSLRQESGADKDDESFELRLDNPQDLRESRSGAESEGNKMYREAKIVAKISPADKKSGLLYLNFISVEDKQVDEIDEAEEAFNDKEAKDAFVKDELEQTKANVKQGNRQEVPEDKRRILDFFTTIKESVFPKKIKTMIRLYVFSVLSILTIASSLA